MNRQEHLLTIAGEEAAEVTKRCSKAARFGLDQVQADAGHAVTGHPDESLRNDDRIRKEFCDLIATLEMLGILPMDVATMRRMVNTKRLKVEEFLAYSKSVGTLTER